MRSVETERTLEVRVGGEGIMEALLTWERIPWVLRRWVSDCVAMDWSAVGWCGQLLLFDGSRVDAALSLARQQRTARLQLTDLGVVDLTWQPHDARLGEAQPGEAQPGEAQPGEARAMAPRTLVRAHVHTHGVTEDALWGRGLQIALRRLLLVAEMRARLLAQRIDAAGFPAQRCRRCFGPLSMSESGDQACCQWGGHWPG